ncbi:MAG: hypothetical protein ACRCVT_14300 [Leadbetterella sp.]
MLENETYQVGTTWEIEVNVKTTDKATGKVIDAIAAGAKLTKADSGRIGQTALDTITVNIDPCDVNDGGCGCPKMAIKAESQYLPIEN